MEVGYKDPDGTISVDILLTPEQIDHIDSFSNEKVLIMAECNPEHDHSHIDYWYDPIESNIGEILEKIEAYLDISIT